LCQRSIINNLVVDEHLRGRGLGEGLLREAIQHCERRGIVELHIWTDFDNKPAIGLYRKLGFMDRSLLLELNVRSA
jgi:ribosomal-protein-alanine N-acetyltransferase